MHCNYVLIKIHPNLLKTPFCQISHTFNKIHLTVVSQTQELQHRVVEIRSTNCQFTQCSIIEEKNHLNVAYYVIKRHHKNTSIISATIKQLILLKLFFVFLPSILIFFFFTTNIDVQKREMKRCITSNLLFSTIFQYIQINKMPNSNLTTRCLKISLRYVVYYVAFYSNLGGWPRQ